MSGNRNQPPIVRSHAVPNFAARLVEVLAVTDRFVGWWGAHRAWPANECAQIDCRH